MRYFLIHTVVTLPEDEEDALAQLRRDEALRASELQRDGTLVALWREAGRLASFGIWRGNDEEHVRSAIASLPMYRYMTTTIAELDRHPNAIGTFPFTSAASTAG